MSDTSDTQPLLADGDAPPPAPPIRAPPATILYFMTLHFLIAFTEMVLVAPLLRLEESSLCLQYYSVHDPGLIHPDRGGVSEELCKIAAVQGPLARVRGWKSMLDTVPGRLFLLSVVGLRGLRCTGGMW